MHYRLRVEMIRVEDGTQVWVEDLLVERSRIAGLETELVDRLAFRLSSDTLSERRSSKRTDYRFRSPEPGLFLPSDQPDRPFHLRRSRARAGESASSSAKPTRSSSARIMNGRPWSATGCRMGSSICSVPLSSIHRFDRGARRSGQSLRRAEPLRLHVAHRGGGHRRRTAAIASPATGPVRRRGHRGPRRQVFVAGVINGYRCIHPR